MIRDLFKKFQMNTRIGTHVMIGIIIVNFLTMSLVFTTLYFYFENVMGNQALQMAKSQLEVNVKSLNEEIERIESATQVLNFGIVNDFSLTSALTSQYYLDVYNDSLVGQLKSIGEQAHFSISVYVFFNHELFGRPVDAWLLEIEEGIYERQAVIPLEYFDQYWEWYHVPIEEHQAVWTFPYVDTVGNSNNMIISSYTQPIFVDDVVVGLCGMDIKLDDLAETLNSSNLYENGELYLLYNDGRTIIHPEYELGTLPSQVDIFDRWIDTIIKNDNGVFEHKSDGQNMVVAYSHLNNGWIVSTIIPKTEVFSALGQFLIVMSVIMLVSLVLSIVFANMISRRISRPIETMNDVFKNIGEGNLNYKVPEKIGMYSDEISSLAESAEMMRYQLQMAFNNIQQDNEILENLVEERTSQIKQVNEELKLSLTKLEDQQMMLLEADRYRTSRFLIQNLAHRLNTPISSTIMSVDFVKTTMMDDEGDIPREILEESLQIIEYSQRALKDIVDSLNHLLEPYENVMFDKVNLLDAIKIGIHNFSYDAQYNIDCGVNIAPDLIVHTAPVLLYQLIQQMLILAADELDDVKEINVAFDCEYDNDEVIMVYRDFNQNLNFDRLQFFTPYSNHLFNSDASGMDLFILYDMVIRGMEATVEINTDETECLEIKVYMDRVIEH